MAGVSSDFAVDRDTAVGDHSLDFPARRDSGTGEQLGDAFTWPGGLRGRFLGR